MENKQKSEGLIYYSKGKRVAARLAVSIHSCRKHYSGPITIISDSEGYTLNKAIADNLNSDIIKVDLNDSHALLNKCLLGTVTPYDRTIFLDADTLVINKFDELFTLIDKYQFLIPQFTTWSAKATPIRRRILAWKDIYPKDSKIALSFPHALNTGVFAFSKDSQFNKDWYKLAIPGRGQYIPDEMSCQIMISKYTHLVISKDYNTSCKYDQLCPTTKIVHYHGRKNCRWDEDNKKWLFNADLWIKEFKEIMNYTFMKDIILEDTRLVSSMKYIS
jgi:hypothetical protein